MWHRANDRREGVLRRAGDELVDEGEAFLAGNIAVHLDRRDKPVPDWAWLNALAHGAAARVLPPCANEPANPFSSERSWCEALGFLDEELDIISATSGVERDELCRRVLVPLELELAASRARPPLGPGQLARRVLAALGAYLASHQS